MKICKEKNVDIPLSDFAHCVVSFKSVAVVAQNISVKVIGAKILKQIYKVHNTSHEY